MHRLVLGPQWPTLFQEGSKRKQHVGQGSIIRRNKHIQGATSSLCSHDIRANLQHRQLLFAWILWSPLKLDVRATCAGYECSQGRSVRRKTCEVQDTPQGAYRVCSETVRCFRVCAGREQEVSTSVTETREPILPHSQPGGVSADDVSGMLSEFFAFAKEVQHDFISSAGCAKAEGLTPPAHTQGLLGRWFNSKHAGSEHNPPGGPQQGSASEASALPHLAQHLASSHCAYPAQDV
ncbi:hypothetical protein HaLaN_04121 [Haematococcus lacustris]|uniref:Uncharacterized protein n=1 Tax=Haematococcus lacustris TaxID=44745 RepID=A0A699YFV0_HAELA|nr:hypothetical protein HaLaN_04121 [Haematococcus lacustris]